MGDVGQQPRLGRRGPLGPLAPGPRPLGQPVAFFQQSRDHQDRHITQQHQKLRQQGPVLGLERVIGAVPRHRPADRHDRHHDQRRGDARDPEPHRHHQQQRHQQEAVGQAQMRKNRVAGEADQPQQDAAFSQARGLAHDQQMAPLQGQPEGADHGEAERVTAPPDAETIKDFRADHGVQRQGAQEGARQRRDGADAKEPRQTLDGVDAKSLYEPPRQNHRQNDLKQVHRGEHGRQDRPIADQELARQHAGRHQDAEAQIIGQAAPASEPDG
ncbi:hypothetical protein D3C86_1139600 [compost metagenome]